jgi:hypothetical protein
MREKLRSEKLGKFRVTLWATNKTDRRGQTGIAWQVKESGKTVAESSAGDLVYGSPMHADDSMATFLSACNLIAYTANHDEDENKIDPGWDTEGLSDLASMLEEDLESGELDEDEN